MRHRPLRIRPGAALVGAFSLACACTWTGLPASSAGLLGQIFNCPTVEYVDCSAIPQNPNELPPPDEPVTGADPATSGTAAGTNDPSSGGSSWSGGPGQLSPPGGAAGFQSVGSGSSGGPGSPSRRTPPGGFSGLGSLGGGSSGGSSGLVGAFGVPGGTVIAGFGIGSGTGSGGSSDPGSGSGSTGGSGAGDPGGPSDPGGAGGPSDPGGVSPPIGTSQSNPIAPLPGSTYVFQYTATPGGAGNTTPLFFDPPAATGYDFQVLSGPNFASVEIPTPLSGTGQTQFTLTFGSETDTLTVGVPFLFTSVDPGGISEFKITGILDGGSTQSLAFDTAITFVDGGNGSFQQTPLFPNPEPGSFTLLGLGASVVLGWRRARRR